MPNKPKRAATYPDFNLNPHCRVYVKDCGHYKEYDIYLTDVIAGVDSYTDMLNSLFSCEEDDIVHLKINSPGGNMDTGLQIQDAIRRCAGRIIGYLSGSADSAASAIFLSCDAYIVSDFASMLVHNASAGAVGPIQDVIDRATFLQKHTSLWVRETYKNFLTEDEMQDLILNKREMYLLADQIRERLQQKVEKDAEEAGIALDEAGYDMDADAFPDFEQLTKDVAMIKELVLQLIPAPKAAPRRTRTKKEV